MKDPEEKEKMAWKKSRRGYIDCLVRFALQTRGELFSKGQPTVFQDGR